MLDQLFSLILVDESAQATEPDIVQVLTLARSLTMLCQIGDHKQLPATVSHPANKAANKDVSLFQKLLLSGNIPYVVPIVQHRMQEAIAAYPSFQFYAGTLLTDTLRRDLPNGFYWPSDDPVAFVHVRSRSGEQSDRNGGSSSM